MKNIAIFVSGAGEATERIVKLFNDGNRLRTVLVIADSSAETLSQRITDPSVTVMNIPDDKWRDYVPEVVTLVREKDVKLVVLDGFRLFLPDEILEAVNGEMVRISSPEMAPREVVAALEADLRSPKEEEIKAEEKDRETPSLESEWADTLKIQFTPPKVPVTPPEIPNSTSFESSRTSLAPKPTLQSSTSPKEPMPSTWLIWSILVTVFCCFIPGIVAIIFSSQVSSKYYSGDIEGSRRASRMAEIWIIVSVVLGIVTATLYFPIMMIG